MPTDPMLLRSVARQQQKLLNSTFSTVPDDKSCDQSKSGPTIYVHPAKTPAPIYTRCRSPTCVSPDHHFIVPESSPSRSTGIPEEFCDICPRCSRFDATLSILSQCEKDISTLNISKTKTYLCAKILLLVNAVSTILTGITYVNHPSLLVDISIVNAISFATSSMSDFFYLLFEASDKTILYPTAMKYMKNHQGDLDCTYASSHVSSNFSALLENCPISNSEKLHDMLYSIPAYTKFEMGSLLLITWIALGCVSFFVLCMHNDNRILRKFWKSRKNRDEKQKNNNNQNSEHIYTLTHAEKEVKKKIIRTVRIIQNRMKFKFFLTILYAFCAFFLCNFALHLYGTVQKSRCAFSVARRSALQFTLSVHQPINFNRIAEFENLDADIINDCVPFYNKPNTFQQPLDTQKIYDQLSNDTFANHVRQIQELLLKDFNKPWYRQFFVYYDISMKLIFDFEVYLGFFWVCIHLLLLKLGQDLLQRG